MNLFPYYIPYFPYWIKYIYFGLLLKLQQLFSTHPEAIQDVDEFVLHQNTFGEI